MEDDKLTPINVTLWRSTVTALRRATGNVSAALDAMARDRLGLPPSKHPPEGRPRKVTTGAADNGPPAQMVSPAEMGTMAVSLPVGKELGVCSSCGESSDDGRVCEPCHASDDRAAPAHSEPPPCGDAGRQCDGCELRADCQPEKWGSK
jgi:hypothetical protein